jgi:hypothetical protein
LDYFPDPKFLSRGSAFVRYAMEKDRRYFLLTSYGVEPTPWRVIAGPYNGNGTVQTNVVGSPSASAAFYRLLIQ